MILLTEAEESLVRRRIFEGVRRMGTKKKTSSQDKNPEKSKVSINVQSRIEHEQVNFLD